MKYSLPFRLWHWSNALVVLALLGTVFLRKTFLSYRTNSEILLQKLAEFNITITIDQAKILAKAIRAGMWEWHIILGYALAFLILMRLFLFIKDSSFKPLFSELNTHKKSVYILHVTLYAALFFMAISGLAIHFDDFLGLSKEFSHTLKELHEAVFNFVLYFVPVHIIGVIIAESKEEKGLVSTMINGKQN